MPLQLPVGVDGALFARLAEIALRAAVLLALARLGAAALWRSGPALRQGLWSAVLVGALLLPAMAAVLPALRVLPVAPAWRSAPPADAAPTHPAAPARVQETGVAWPLPGSLAGSVSRSPARADDGHPFAWRLWALQLWALGSAAVALWFAAGLAVLRSISRRALPAGPRLQALARQAAARVGVTRPVRVVVSPRISSPATWGLRRPLIALPAAAERWSAERRRLVLTHELVHVASWDWALRLVAQLGCVAYWFNPLAWIAARQLRREQELACDQAVLDLGARPSTYARHLLNIARGATRRRALPALALDMARRSQMEGRLMSILAERPARSRRAAVLPALSVLVALPVLAAVQPKAPAPPVPAQEPRPAAAAAPVVVPEVVASAVPALAPVSTGAPAPAVVPAAAPAASPTPVAVLAQAPAASPAPEPGTAAEPGPAPSPPPAAGTPLAAGTPAPPPAADRRRGQLEEEIARRAAEIESLMAPLQEEIARQMEEQMGPILEQMQSVELEMQPFQEEMSRIGAEMSRMLETEMPDAALSEELARQSEELAREMAERARAVEELMESEPFDAERMRENAQRLQEELTPLRQEMLELHRRMAEQRIPAEELRARLEPLRLEMEEARRRFEPQRERLEALRLELEPMRESIERLREEHMAQVHERMEALRRELRALEIERRTPAPDHQ